jgi:hypothetical protein
MSKGGDGFVAADAPVDRATVLSYASKIPWHKYNECVARTRT